LESSVEYHYAQRRSGQLLLVLMLLMENSPTRA
jgi:hypothetical protein